MIDTENLIGSEAVEMQTDAVLPGEEYISVRREEYEEMCSRNQQLSTDLCKADRLADKLKKKQEELEKQIEILGHDLALARLDAENYVSLAYAKETYALQLEKKLQEQEKKVRPGSRSLFHRAFAKIRKVPGFVRRKLGGLKRRLKRMIGRGA